MKNIKHEFEHDICFWDNTHIIASRPIRTPKYQYSSLEPNIDLDDCYVLNGNTKIRKETFGCIIQNQDAFTIKCFDQDAFEFFSRTKAPLTGLELLKLSKGNEKFVKDRIKDLTIRKNDKPSSAEFYNFSNLLTPVSAPIAIEVEMTRKCRRKCDYCAYDSSPHVRTDQ